MDSLDASLAWRAVRKKGGEFSSTKVATRHRRSPIAPPHAPAPLTHAPSCFSCPIRMAGCTLLVTAHPDDEAMFFSPTILHLIEQGLRVALLCVSTGAAQVAGGGSGRRRPHPSPS